MAYITERDGQIDFYTRFLPRVSSTLRIEDVLGDSNDGVVNGNLLEFKLNIADLNSTLLQAIKYLSALRVKGKPVPAGIHLIDLNAGIDYYYLSEPYLQDIERVYFGAASKNNGGFAGGTADSVLHYETSQVDAQSVIRLLKANTYTKIHIDENCIVGWAAAFYSASPMSRKEDFLGDDTGKHKTIGEIRQPDIFKDYIIPYDGATNVRFKYLMDRLNDTLQKKNLGAFYTHSAYAEKSLELVRKAIARVPADNDYIILDRCAGTGNLEAGLTADELSHCIVSTVEYYEYKVLLELYGSSVRAIIPPTESDSTFNAGLVRGADALSKEYIDNPIIKQYINDPNCTVILFENPPYAETTSIEHQKKGKGKKSSTWKKSYVVEEMKKEVKGTATNDLGNAFIWSAFKYYLRQPTDSYIVFSPVKYWKAQHLINRKFLGGFAFNRRHFHTNIDACIMCACWSYETSSKKEISIEAFDIDANGQLVMCGTLPIKRISTLYSKKYYDKRTFPDDKSGTVVVGFDGIERQSKGRVTPKVNKNIIGYMTVETSGFDNPDLHASLLSATLYNGHGFFLRKDNYLEKLPMFAASRYITYNRSWTERARIMKSADGAKKFEADVKSGKLEQFLLKCLLFTCLEMQNHMRSFYGSDGNYYRNELCFDDTHGNTIAARDIKKLAVGSSEQKLLDVWDSLLNHAKAAQEYDGTLTYGVYQIHTDIDTYTKDPVTGDIIYNNVSVHSELQALRSLIKDYYNTEIVPTLFEYEFLK